MTTVIRGTDDSASTPALTGTDADTGVFFPAANTMAMSTGGSERMRIDSSGNVGIGTSSPGAKFVVNQTGTGGYFLSGQVSGTEIAYWYYDANQIQFSSKSAGRYLTFLTADAERARITSGGYFKASNNGAYNDSTGPYHELRQTGVGSNLFVTTQTSGDPYGGTIDFTGTTPNNTTNYFLRCSDTTNTKLFIYSNGTVTNRTGTYNSFSDLKLKQDITDASSQWNDIKSLRVVKYRLKDEVAADPDYPSYIGLIAQEAEQVSPGLVDNCPDYEEVEVTDEEGNVTTERQATGTVTKAVKYSILYMKAVKALQEAMERIETLEAKVAALEAK